MVGVWGWGEDPSEYATGGGVMLTSRQSRMKRGEGGSAGAGWWPYRYTIPRNDQSVNQKSEQRYEAEIEDNHYEF